MEKSINGIIGGPKFEEEFYQIWRLNCNKEYSSEEILKIDNEKLIESKGFSTKHSQIRTRTNPANELGFGGIVERVMQSPKS